ncbi:MAG: SRPBCC family protein [Planctomycetaceae bacterium]|nr:SRPBCC family protein [Planctomycetaceae bacterium]
MPHGAVSQIIPASSAAVFDLVHDYRRRLEWDTLLSSASLTDGHTQAGLGATTLCVGRGWLRMIAMKAQYVAFDRPRLTAIKMINSPPFFASCGASIRHEDIAANHSRITYTWTFTVRPRWLAWLLAPVMNRVFAWEASKRLAALREHFARTACRRDHCQARSAGEDAGLQIAKQELQSAN